MPNDSFIVELAVPVASVKVTVEPVATVIVVTLDAVIVSVN